MLRSKPGLSAPICSRRRIPELRTRRERRASSSSEMQNTAAERPQPRPGRRCRIGRSAGAPVGNPVTFCQYSFDSITPTEADGRREGRGGFREEEKHAESAFSRVEDLKKNKRITRSDGIFENIITNKNQYIWRQYGMFGLGHADVQATGAGFYPPALVVSSV